MPDKVDPEIGFRSALEDLIAIVQKLAPLTTSTEHLIEIAQLALENDSQLQFLMNVVKSKK